MNLDNIIIKSMKPMYYIDEEYQIVELKNNPDNAEVIELKKGITKEIIPINTKITVIVPLALFLFRTKEDAEEFGRFFDNPDLLSKNAQTQSQSKKNITVISSDGEEVESGLYTLKDLDKGTVAETRKRYRYIDENRKICEIKTIKEESVEEYVITEYINRTSTLESINLANNVVIFELLYEKGKTYVTYYCLDPNLSTNKTILVSDLNSYRLFTSKSNAKSYLYNFKLFGKYSEMESVFNLRDDIVNTRNAHEIRKETMKKVFSIIAKFVWNNKSVIVSKAIQLYKKFKDRNGGSDNIADAGGVTEEGADNTVNKIIEMIQSGDIKIIG